MPEPMPHPTVLVLVLVLVVVVAVCGVVCVPVRLLGHRGAFLQIDG
jgi:hypothetical protein